MMMIRILVLTSEACTVQSLANVLMENGRSTLLLHEFFHTCEPLANIHVSHGFLDVNRIYFPEWTGKGKSDYYTWHFKTTFSKLGWKNVSYRRRYLDVPFSKTLLPLDKGSFSYRYGRTQSEQKKLEECVDLSFQSNLALSVSLSPKVGTNFSFLFGMPDKSDLKTTDSFVFVCGNKSYKFRLPIYSIGSENFKYSSVYTVTAGSVRVIVLDSSQLTLGALQTEWLKKQLAENHSAYTLIFTQIPFFSDNNTALLSQVSVQKYFHTS